MRVNVVLAHVLEVRRDLPLPEWLFGWGAAVVLVVSFILLALSWHVARFEDPHRRAAPAWLSRAIVNRGSEALAGAAGASLLALVIWCGLAGTQAPARNFAVTFVFVTTWLGGVVVSALCGDVLRALNPWRALAGVWTGAILLITRRRLRAPFTLPAEVGRWPAVIALVAFAWFYVIYGKMGFGASGVTPDAVALATLGYSAYTLLAMGLFGRKEWLDHGEAFSVYFGMFARLAPVEVREGRLGFRRPLTGLRSWADDRGSVALVLVTISITIFDSASEGVLQRHIASVVHRLVDLGCAPVTALRLGYSLYFGLVIVAVSLFFWAGVRGMRTVKTTLSTRRLASMLAPALVPIALGYLLAHYFSFFVFQIQGQFSYLLSDPLGSGSDLFGTASGAIDYGVLSTNAIWYVMVASLLAGHLVALILAHDRAIAVLGDASAARSQYWMLGLTVGFTWVGLWLLAQPS